MSVIGDIDLIILNQVDEQHMRVSQLVKLSIRLTEVVIEVLLAEVTEELLILEREILHLLRQSLQRGFEGVLLSHQLEFVLIREISDHVIHLSSQLEEARLHVSVSSGLVGLLL